MELDCNTKSRRINELEQWILCLTNSTLVAAGNKAEADSLSHQIKFCIERMNKLFQENFQLKKEIAYEKKRYLDLMNAFIEMRNQIKQDEIDKGQTTDIAQVLKEKQQLQTTLQTLSEEVEFLSKKNELFLVELKTKDFYQTYKDCQDELNKLREAHTILIGMIQNHHLSIGSYSQSSPKSQSTSSGNLILYKNTKATAQSAQKRGATKMPNNCHAVKKDRRFTNNKTHMSEIQHPEIISNRGRSSSIQSFITCGTLLGNHPSQRQKDPEEINDDVFQKALLNNEYIQIVRDPDFNKRSDVNFLQR